MDEAELVGLTEYRAEQYQYVYEAKGSELTQQREPDDIDIACFRVCTNITIDCGMDFVLKELVVRRLLEAQEGMCNTRYLFTQSSLIDTVSKSSPVA